ncbi:AraC family transcriptional regulator [Winogradskyella sp.]|uniref:helix-turn-helix domain-containing protein n=1 Tax=Winogradskyella sp. TaxID=1883156 RepID=UPI0026372AB3|nr:helix-turn-helix domain-containing protein [Winogradskyella sp.]
MDSYIDFVLFLGLAQGFFLIITILFANKKSNTHNYYLILLIVLFAIVLIHQILNRKSWFVIDNFLFYFSFSTPLLIGPVLYFYIKGLLFKTSLQKIDLLHYVPFLVVIIYFILRDLFGISHLDSQESKDETPIYVSVIGSFKIIHLITYSIYLTVLLNKYNRTKTQSREQKSVLNWLRVFMLLFLTVLFLGVFVFVLGHLDIDYPPILDDNLPTLGLVFVFYFIAFMSIKNSDIFHIRGIRKKYQDSNLDYTTKDIYLDKIKNEIEKNKIYLNSELKLQEFADTINISSNYLSQIINEHYNLTFREFLNSYRVKEVQSRLIDPSYRNQTILSIAFDAGFNSKAVFNRAFKKFTDITPKQYQKKYASLDH